MKQSGRVFLVLRPPPHIHTPPPPPPCSSLHFAKELSYSSIKIFGSAAPGSDVCINPVQSLPSPLLAPLQGTVSPRSWGSGHTWCSWTPQRSAWQRWWCRSPRPAARCSRGRRKRPSHRWHTGNTECWKRWRTSVNMCGHQRADERDGVLGPLTCRPGWCSPEGYGRNTSRWASRSRWGPGVHNRRRGRCQRNTAAWQPGSSTAPLPNSAYSSHSNLQPIRTTYIILHI